MDKFVVRTRRGSRSELLKKRPKKHLKQATIESLQVELSIFIDLYGCSAVTKVCGRWIGGLVFRCRRKLFGFFLFFVLN